MLVHLTSNAAINLRVGSVQSIIFSFINSSSTYVVPPFIFISGVTLYYRYKDCELDSFDFYYKRFKSTFIPYFIWVAIYNIFFIRYFGYELSIEFFIKNLMLGSMVYHLYFVVIIAQFYIIFPLILYLYKKYNILFLTIIVLLINLISSKYLVFKYSDRFFLNYIFFFGLGFVFVTYLDKINEFIKTHKLFIIIINVAVTIFYFMEVYLERNYGIKINPIGYTWHVFSVTSILFYYYISIKIIERSGYINKTLKDISNNSYTIYLSHPIILIILGFLYKGQPSIIFETVYKGIILLAFVVLYSKYNQIMFKKIQNYKMYFKVKFNLT